MIYSPGWLPTANAPAQDKYKRRSTGRTENSGKTNKKMKNRFLKMFVFQLRENNLPRIKVLITIKVITGNLKLLKE
jgi:hypothetical protein